MELKDKFSISIGVVALVLSLITGYYQFFYDESELVMHSSMLSFTQNKSIDYDLTFTNTGTLPVAVTRLWGIDSKTPNFEAWSYDLDVQEPFVIPPKSIVQKRITHNPHVYKHDKQFYTGLSIVIIEADSKETHRIIWQNSPIPNNWHLMGKGSFDGRVVLTDHMDGQVIKPEEIEN